jgi:glycyl-tRNA synthetase beta chain
LVDQSLLEAGPEKDLYEAYAGLAAFGPLEHVAGLRPYVDRFFDKVMVNAPDPKIRENRLSMLSDMLHKFSTIADFSEIVTAGDQTKS